MASVVKQHYCSVIISQSEWVELSPNKHPFLPHLHKISYDSLTILTDFKLINFKYEEVHYSRLSNALENDFLEISRNQNNGYK